MLKVMKNLFFTLKRVMKTLRNSKTRISAIIIVLLIIAIFGGIILTISYEVQNDKNQNMIIGGKVVDKEYTPSHTAYYTNGNNRIVPYYVGPRYCVKVEGDNGYSAWYDVIEQVYYNIKIGDYFSNVNRSLK